MRQFEEKSRKNLSIIFVINTLEEGIGEKIEKVKNFFNKADHSYEIILFHNGASDEDFKQLKESISRLPSVIAIQQKTPLANGWAIKESLRYFSGEYVVFYNYNHNLYLRDLNNLLQKLKQKNLDLVVGYKKDTEKSFYYNWIHKLLRRSYFFIIDFLFGPGNKDILPNIKIFKASVLEDILARIVAKTYVLGLELLVVANHLRYRVGSLPMELETGKEYRHRVSFRIIFSAIGEVLGIYYRLRLLKYYDREQNLPHHYPSVSIVVPVKERNHYLEECVSACQRLDYPDYEIIVLPDEEIGLQGNKIKVIPTGNLTPPQKRDIGIKHTRGEVIAFLDSDAFPLSSWLKYAARYFANAEVGAVCGPAMTPRSDNLWQRASGAIFSSFIVGGNCKFRYVPMPHREVEDYPSCNLLVRKLILEEVGGFNTRLYPGDDTLLCFKIVERAKKKIIYDPDVVVYHHRRPLFFKHFRQLASYALHRGYFARKFPKTSCKLSYFLPSLLLIIFFLLGLSTAFFPFTKLYFLFLLGLYGAFTFLTAVKTMNCRLIPLVFGGIIATHIIYGFWFIRGLLARKMPEERG